MKRALPLELYSGGDSYWKGSIPIYIIIQTTDIKFGKQIVPSLLKKKITIYIDFTA